MAEILGKKEVNGKQLFYVHYEDCKYYMGLVATKPVLGVSDKVPLKAVKLLEN